MLKDCKDDKKKVRIFKLLYGSVFVQNLISGIMTASFKKNLSDGKKAKFIVRVGDNDFNLSGLVPKNPDTLIEDNMQFNLGGTDVHLIHLGSIHSGSDMIVWIPSEKILFAGDIFADCSLPMSIENGKKWIQAMDYILEELKPEIIVPGHGEIYDFKRAENQREYFKSLIGQVEHYYTPTIKNEELIKKIDVEKYIDCRPGLLWILAVNNMANQLRKDKI